MGRKLAIIHVFTHSSISRGGAVQGLDLAKKQFERGHSVLCIFHKPSGFPLDKTLNRNFPFPVVHMDMKNPFFYLRFARLLQDFSPDVVHCHRNLALLFAFFSLRWLARSKKSVLVINRGTTYELPNWIVRQVFRSGGLDHVIAVAEAVKKKLVEDEGIPADKVTVIYGSYDENRFHDGINGDLFREELGLGQDDRLVVSIAAVDRRKGLEYLARAIKMVKDCGISVKCVVVGRIDDVTYHQEVMEEVKRLGLINDFVFCGHRDDIPEILFASDVSVSSSMEGEGLTGALRESLAMKRPVVATAVSGNPELIIDGKTGWLVKPGDPEDMARALVEALTDRAEAEKRAHTGYGIVKAMCSLEKRYERVISLYEKLILRRCIL
ncbi:MAG: glycosyltransferase family 4 protein [Thermodesulforhabdaceae bacterium]|jgi:glycosyltransferase involved in cell wall biosynthesis